MGGPATSDGIVNLRGVIRGNKLVSILDHEGKDLGAPVTAKESLTGGLRYSSGAVTLNPHQLINGGTVLLFGDSLMSKHGCYSGGQPYWLDTGFWVWAAAKLGGRLLITHNSGVAGNTTDQMLARWDADVVPYPARFLALEGGVNDTITAAATIANMQTMVGKALQLGYLVVLHTPGPYTNNNNAVTMTRMSIIDAGYRKIAAQTPGVILADMYGTMIDPLDLNGNMVSTYSDDSPKLHPNVSGARAIGNMIASIMAGYLDQSLDCVVSQSNSVSKLGATATQLLVNPLLVASGGTVSGTNQTGVAPADFTCSVKSGALTGVWSTPARSDGRGNNMHCVISAAGAGSGVWAYTASYHANVVEGDEVWGEAFVSQASMVACSRIKIAMNVTDSRGAQDYIALDTNATTYDQTDFADYKFVTPKTTITGTCTNLRFTVTVFFNAGGSGSFDIGVPVIRRTVP